MFKRFEAFTSRKTGMAAILITDILAAYGFASLAIDRGNLLWYALGLFFLVDALKNLFKLIGAVTKRSKRRV